MTPNTFSGATLDRAAERRSDADWVDAARQDPRARAVLVSHAGVGLDGGAPAPGEDAWAERTGERRAPRFVALDGREPVLLGVTGDGAPLWAMEASEDEAVVGLREAASVLSAEDAGLLAYAQQLLHWRRTNRFCGTCGEPTAPREAGHTRVCPNEHTTHPRTDPVVIMLVLDDHDRALLGRQPAWPPGRYSALAGFVDPGESLEAAVAREVREEAAIDVTGVTYHSSQPWPFPANLMLGFYARHAGGEVVADEQELEDARWFTRAEIEAAVSGDGPLKLPPPTAIARRLIDAWLAP